jgi:hypothetical protein
MSLRREGKREMIARLLLHLCTLPLCTVPLTVAVRSTLSLFIFTRMNFSPASSQILWSEQQDGNTVTSTGAKQTDHNMKLIEQRWNDVQVRVLYAKFLSSFFSFNYLHMKTYIYIDDVDKSTWIIAMYELMIIWSIKFLIAYGPPVEARIAQYVYLLASGWADGVQFLVRSFLFSTASRPGLGPYPVSYKMCNSGSSATGKAAGAWNWPFPSI